MLLSKDDKKKRRLCLFVFLTAIFVFIMMWACIQPLNASPDESMRYDIVNFIINHGCLPDGRDPEIRNEIWGISYAYYPILSYMIMAVPAKIVSFFTTDVMAVVIAARVVNAVFGTVTAYITFRISEMLFKGKAGYLFTVLVTLLPGVIFVQSYVNNDAMALLSTAWITYVWIRSVKEGWTKGLCIHLSFAIAMCALSYYNAYGFILCSIIFFFTTIVIGNDVPDKTKYVVSRTMLIVILVLALAGWWFVRNYILYGDFTGWNITTQYAEMYAIDGFKPSQRDNLAENGVSVFGLLKLHNPGEYPWVIRVIVSFVGVFGFLNIFMPMKLTMVYLIIFLAGTIGFFISAVRLFRIREKKEDGNKCFSKMAMFNWCMLLVIVITIAFLIYYNLYSDLQAQGRYLIPMVIPFMYFVTCGIQRLLDIFIKNEKIKDIVYYTLCIVIIIATILSYALTFYPAYAN